ncbi:MAG: hypothetical protein M0T84_05705 [Betaproteobacteria bacterium]|nr:hypothetical protein [Betaproteobacteria bacterium]
MTESSRQKIFDDAAEIADPKVSGKWFPIRLTPDVATGELLNIGVGFIDSRHKLSVRMLDSGRAFRCLYGAAGTENFSLLMAAAHEHFQRTGKPESPSPHILIGPRAYAAGESVDDILDRLFRTMVTLVGSDDDESEGPGAETIDTPKLRKLVFRAARKYARGIFETMFHEEPLSLADSSNQSHVLDLPIWARDPDLFRDGPRYGTIVSAHFRSPVYRGFNLNGGCLNLWNTRSIINDNGRGAFLILRPAEGSAGYSQSLISDIDNEIDRAVWPFLKLKNMLVEVATDPDKIADTALSLAN